MVFPTVTSDPKNPPVCDCHGVEQFWTRDKEYRLGGRWRCRVKREEYQRRYVETHQESVRRNARGRSRRWRKAHPEKVRERNAQRIRVGGMYLGMSGFTAKEREAILRGPSN